MNAKPWYHSKTAWFNILSFVSVILLTVFEPSFDFRVSLPILFASAANFALRFSTTEIVTWTKGAADRMGAIFGEVVELEYTPDPRIDQIQETVARLEAMILKLQGGVNVGSIGTADGDSVHFEKVEGDDLVADQKDH